MVLGVVDEPVDGATVDVVYEPVGGVTVGIVGAATPDPAVPAKGDTFVIGTVVAELIPRLPIL